MPDTPTPAAAPGAGDIDWIFFDLDGTLWDHDSASAEALLATCARFEIPHDPFAPLWHEANLALWKRLGSGTISFAELRTARFEDALLAMERGPDSRLADAMSADYLARYTTRPRPFALAGEVLRAAAGRARVAVLTNAGRAIQERKIAHLGAESALIRFMLCGDDIDCLKPAPRFYEEALRLAGATEPGRVLMIGDSWNEDVLAPAALGWRTGWISHGRPAPGPLPDRQFPSLEGVLATLNPPTAPGGNPEKSPS